MYNHNKAQQSKNRVHISWDILYDNGAVDVNHLYIQDRFVYKIMTNGEITNPDNTLYSAVIWEV